MRARLKILLTRADLFAENVMLRLVNTASDSQRRTQKSRVDVCAAPVPFAGRLGSAARPAASGAGEVSNAGDILLVITWEGFRNSFLRHWIAASKPNPPPSFVALSCCRFISRQIDAMSSDLLGG